MKDSASCSAPDCENHVLVDTAVTVCMYTLLFCSQRYISGTSTIRDDCNMFLCASAADEAGFDEQQALGFCHVSQNLTVSERQCFEEENSEEQCTIYMSRV